VLSQTSIEIEAIENFFRHKLEARGKNSMPLIVHQGVIRTVA